MYFLNQMVLLQEGAKLNCEIKLWNLTDCCEIVELFYSHLLTLLLHYFVSWKILHKREFEKCCYWSEETWINGISSVYTTNLIYWCWMVDIVIVD